MADMRGTTPVKSIRMSDETKGLFDKINKEFGSQDRTMRALISAYESCAIGELYPESKSYITDALAYISGIEAIIKALITAKEEAEKTAAENVKREMEIKDRTIETYQKQVAELDAVRARAEAAEIRADKAEDTVRRLEKELDGVQVLSDAVAEMDSIRARLTATQEELVSTKGSLAAKDETIALLRALIPARES